MSYPFYWKYQSIISKVNRNFSIGWNEVLKSVLLLIILMTDLLTLPSSFFAGLINWHDGFCQSPVYGIECFHMFVLRWSAFWFKSSLRISFSCLSCKKKLALQRIHFTTLYIQSNLESIFPKTNFGLYRNDGLILLRNLNGQ